MEVRCHASKRFLMNINIEDYLKDLERIGISQANTFNNRNTLQDCKTIEVYELYKTNIKFIKSYKKSVNKKYYKFNKHK